MQRVLKSTDQREKSKEQSREQSRATGNSTTADAHARRCAPPCARNSRRAEKRRTEQSGTDPGNSTTARAHARRYTLLLARTTVWQVGTVEKEGERKRDTLLIDQGTGSKGEEACLGVAEEGGLLSLGVHAVRKALAGAVVVGQAALLATGVAHLGRLVRLAVRAGAVGVDLALVELGGKGGLDVGDRVSGVCWWKGWGRVGWDGMGERPYTRTREIDYAISSCSVRCGAAV